MNLTSLDAGTARDSGVLRIISADTDPITGQVFGWQDFTSSFGGGRLVSIDPSTGVTNIEQTFGTPFEVTSISFTPDGTLLATGIDDGGFVAFFQLDPSLGTATKLANQTVIFSEEFDANQNLPPVVDAEGGSGDDVLPGSGGDDEIGGGPGDDIIGGLGGDDLLVGGTGDDILFPGLGSDVMTGGPGIDSFRGTAEELDGDIITDFGLADDLTFISALFSLSDIFLSLGSLNIEVDVDGDGITDSQVTVEGDFPVDQPLSAEADEFGNTVIRLLPINEQPVASDDVFSVSANALEINSFLANDFDPEFGALELIEINGSKIPSGGAITLPSGALLSATPSGAFSYNPNGQFDDLADGATDTDAVSYTVEDLAGATSTATATFEIVGVEESNAPPTAQVSATPNPSAPNQLVTLDATGSSDPDADILSFEWDLDGDGAFDDSTLAIVDITFATFGTRTVGCGSPTVRV